MRAGGTAIIAAPVEQGGFGSCQGRQTIGSYGHYGFTGDWSGFDQLPFSAVTSGLQKDVRGVSTDFSTAPVSNRLWMKYPVVIFHGGYLGTLARQGSAFLNGLTVTDA
ncbi:hypothetical protein HCU01_34680 [Halomonas cupida]|uniref:Uncharacterized protein n=1 Tax=Halomonas cupida TaxID=44933 RepID=A0ABQ0WP56_9GAMM|nr:hypothetical protein HCU01_34680 [Halomonas cupida]